MSLFILGLFGFLAPEQLIKPLRKKSNKTTSYCLTNGKPNVDVPKEVCEASFVKPLRDAKNHGLRTHGG